jgi:hypothetical protein
VSREPFYWQGSSLARDFSRWNFGVSTFIHNWSRSCRAARIIHFFCSLRPSPFWLLLKHLPSYLLIEDSSLINDDKWIKLTDLCIRIKIANFPVLRDIIQMSLNCLEHLLQLICLQRNDLVIVVDLFYLLYLFHFCLFLNSWYFVFNIALLWIARDHINYELILIITIHHAFQIEGALSK